MTATANRVTPLAARRPRAVPDNDVDRRLTRISAQLAAHTTSIAEATDQLYDVYVRTATRSAQLDAVDMPEQLADAYVVYHATGALLDVRVDQQRSALAIARSERRLGQVLVLPCGRTEGATPTPPRRESLDPKELW